MADDSYKPSGSPNRDDLSLSDGPVTIPDHQLLRRIGRGSYGEVWLARNMMGAYRAVKIVYRKWFDDVRPFERELSGIRKFEPISRSYEGFIDVLHVGISEERGYFYYVMELGDDQVAGQAFDPALYFPQTLAKVLSQRGRLPMQECLQLGLALSQALAELHKHGLVHRDVKPSNIIFVNGVPKLADIGLVAPADEARSYVGTEGFIPPEGPGSPQADIYGLGKVLYECGTGKDRQDFPELPTILDQFSDAEGLLELNEVILHACKNETAQRYRSAWDMHADLVVLANGKSVKRLKDLERRLSALKRIVSVSGMVVLVGAFVGYHIYREWRVKLEEVQRQVGANVAYGRNATENGNLLEALPYFAEALRLNRGTPDTEDSHRHRYAATLAQCPKLNQFWTTGIRLDDAEFSPDGRRLVVAEDHRKCRVYDLESGQLCGQPFGGAVGRTRVTYSPDGSLLATANDDVTARIVNAVSFEEISVLRHTNRVNNVRFHPDGRHLLTACADGYARLWDLEAGEVVLTLDHTAPILFAGCSPDGRRIVTAGYDYLARIWSTNGLQLGKPLQHRGWVSSAAFSHDGQRLVTGCHDHKVRVWNVETGEQIRPDLNHAGVVNSVEFSPDDRLILSASTDSTARLWDSGELRPLGSNPVLRHAEPVFRASFSPDGHRFVTVCLDGSIRVWDLAGSTWQPMSISSLYSQDGNRFVTLTSNSFQVFNSASGEVISPVVRPEGPVEKIQLNHKASFVTTTSFQPGEEGRSNRIVQVWDAMTGHEVGSGFTLLNSNVQCQVSDDGKQMVLLTDQDLTCRHIVNQTVRSLELPTNNVGGIYLSPSGDRIAARIEKKVHVWNMVDGKPAYPPLEHIATVGHIDFSGDGRRILTCCWEGRYQKCYAQLWEASTGQPIGPQMRHGDGVLFAAFSPDGRRIVTAGEDARASVWDSQTGRQVTPPLLHYKRVRSASFSFDGKWIVTAASDRTARVWNAETGDPLTPPLYQLIPLVSARFLAGKKSVLTVEEGGKTRVWKLPEDNRPVEDLISIAALLSANAVALNAGLDSAQIEPLESIWQRLRFRYPSQFETTVEEVATWHQFQAEESEMQADWRGAAFHLKRLLLLKPEDRSISNRLARAEINAKNVLSANPALPAADLSKLKK